MADKNTIQKYEQAILSLKFGVEVLNLIVEANKAHISTLDNNIFKLTESNDEMWRNFSELMSFFKKDVVLDANGECSSTQTDHRSTLTGKQPIPPQTPTQFGTINSFTIIDENGKVITYTTGSVN